MKRPMLWVAGMLFALFLAARFAAGDEMDKRYYSMDKALRGDDRAVVQGTLDHIEEKPKSSFFYLKKVSVTSLNSNTEEIYYFSDFLAVLSKNGDGIYEPGNVLRISGTIQPFASPTNPGQFDEKSYYKEKNIYYKVFGDACQVVDAGNNILLVGLYRLKDRLKEVYEACLPEKEAGIITAMLLGDKSTLDMDVRQLYQTGGIGHLLAISGLHVSILCMALYRGLRWLFDGAVFDSIGERILGKGVSRTEVRFRGKGISQTGGRGRWLRSFLKRMPFGMTVCFLLAYGKMTGFGISTSRAVIMMILVLLAGEWGRSYDAYTAMGLSAVIIWLQIPYAVFSSSFLLSYSAMLGVYLVLPALETCFRGTEKERRARLRAGRRREREAAARGSLGRLATLVNRGREKLASSLLCSLAIWLATLPAMCYFFYEFPTYGILLNLFVLPLASVLVVAGMAGGVLGAIFLPAGKGILWIVRGILAFYEQICLAFRKLPHPMQVTGRPGKECIAIYCAVLLGLCLVILSQVRKRERMAKLVRGVMPCIVSVAVVFLCSPEKVRGFSCTFLDVGQGDGIVLRSELGKTILVDGGSTSVSQVGTYRILPFLKYHGISHVDYMIVSHEDEDHISGQMELLEAGRAEGISIGCLLLPEPADAAVGKGYWEMERLARQAGVPCRKLHRGDRISLGKLRIDCLHPERGFAAESANAYSTTLEVRYGERALLLTGDLEKNGEEAVMDVLHHCDVLKVAHHGSKNSSSEAYLEKIRPDAAVISCGENNRYGHPHRELLERLGKVGSRIFSTAERGAVTLTTDGAWLGIDAYREESP